MLSFKNFTTRFCEKSPTFNTKSDPELVISSFVFIGFTLFHSFTFYFKLQYLRISLKISFKSVKWKGLSLRTGKNPTVNP